MHDNADRTRLINRLRRVSGQVDAITRMVDRGDACADVMVQIRAASGALQKVAQLILVDHAKETIDNMGQQGEASETEKKRQLEELIVLFERYGQGG